MVGCQISKLSAPLLKHTDQNRIQPPVDDPGEELERKFLWRKDPVDARDWLAESVLQAARLRVLPDKIKLDYLVSQILDQGGLGSCGPNAVAQALRAAQLRLGAVSPPFASRLFLYYFARAVDGLANTQVDSGTYLRSIFKVISKLGFCSENAWSYDDGPDKFKLMPSAAAGRLAYDQLTGFGYRRIDSTGNQRCDDVRTAIAAGYLVVFGTLVAAAFRDYSAGDAPLKPPGAGEAILGGHALTVGGYGRDYFDIVNSWSPAWGAGGWCQFTEAYIADDRSDDFWIIETIPNFSET